MNYEQECRKCARLADKFLVTTGRLIIYLIITMVVWAVLSLLFGIEIGVFVLPFYLIGLALSVVEHRYINKNSKEWKRIMNLWRINLEARKVLLNKEKGYSGH